MRLLITIVTALLMYQKVAAQTVAINGLVADSATFKPLAGVNLQIKNRFRGTITNDKGYFSLSLNDTDSVILTRVGYQSRTISVKHILLSPIIYLREVNTILNAITISSPIEMGLPKIPPDKKWINPTYTSTYTKTPGLPYMQTFGPSIILKGVFSRFNKYEKELKKLPNARKENGRAKTFISIVSDSLFVNDFTEIYRISRDDYQQVLMLFNQKYGDTIYELPPDELISLLHLFYSDNKKHGTK
jgi:hypothetical protein